MGHLDLGSAQGAHQLRLVVSGHAQRGPGGNHSHDQPQHTRRVRAAVDEVADEDGRPPLGVGATDRAARVVVRQEVAELGEQGLELGTTAVDVADDVERSGELALVVPRLLVGDRRRLDLLDPVQLVHAPESLLAHPADRALQVAPLPGHDVAAEVAVGSRDVALDGHRFGDVEHDRVDHHVVALGQPDQGGPGLLLGVGGVDDCQQTAPQAGPDDVLQDVERVLRRRLVGHIVGDQPATEVTRHDLERAEVLRCERRLAAAGRPDEQHQPELGQPDLTHDGTPPSGSATQGRDGRHPPRAPRPRSRTSCRPGRTTSRTRRGSTRTGGRDAACRSAPGS